MQHIVCEDTLGEFGLSSYNVAPDAPMDERFSDFLERIKPWQVYAQHGEEAILDAIFQRIGTANKWCFECGAADGLFFSNTRLLIERGWDAILVECDSGDFDRLKEQLAINTKVRLHQGYLVAQVEGEHEITLDGVLEKYGAPKEIDLVVLDIDSQEYFILNSMVRYRPRVVLAEYDPDAGEMFIPQLRGKGQAGHLALRYVAEARGYEVIGRTQTNLICVRRDLAPLLQGAATPVSPPSAVKHQVFANGRWQDIGTPG